jgi:hypothetical protein
MTSVQAHRRFLSAAASAGVRVPGAVCYALGDAFCFQRRAPTEIKKRGSRRPYFNLLDRILYRARIYSSVIAKFSSPETHRRRAIFYVRANL